MTGEEKQDEQSQLRALLEEGERSGFIEYRFEAFIEELDSKAAAAI